MSTQEETLADLKRLFVFVRCGCGLVYKVIVRCATNDMADIRCPDCSLPLGSATPTDARFGVPTAMPPTAGGASQVSARRTILLDMDGVCVRFMAAAIKVQGRDPAQVLSSWPKSQWDIADVCGIDNPTFWRRIEAVSPAFWITLQEYDYFQEMYARLKTWGEVFFVTSPAWSADSVQGKIIWLQNRFGKSFRNYVITCQKHLLARPDTILIDDSDKNCEAFSAAGGRAVLFARPWNSGSDLTSEAAYARVMEQTRVIVNRLGGG